MKKAICLVLMATMLITLMGYQNTEARRPHRLNSKNPCAHTNSTTRDKAKKEASFLICELRKASSSYDSYIGNHRLLGLTQRTAEFETGRIKCLMYMFNLSFSDVGTSKSEMEAFESRSWLWIPYWWYIRFIE